MCDSTTIIINLFLSFLTRQICKGEEDRERERVSESQKERESDIDEVLSTMCLSKPQKIINYERFTSGELDANNNNW